MEKVLVLLGITLMVALATGSTLDLSEPEYRSWWDKWQKIFSRLRKSPAFLKEFQSQSQRTSNSEIITEMPFECDISLGVSEESPTSVHRLRPGDIKVVAALGDSITAGFGLGARILPEVILENRGESWSIGANMELDHDVITLPNIIRKFNPVLQGSSICKRYPNHPMAWMNVAVSGAVSRNMPSQAQRLIDKIWADPDIDMYTDWKMVTILIGGNDLCASCRNDDYLPKNYAAKIKEALDLLHDKAPYTIVNLVVMLDVGILRNYTHYDYCQDFQESVCSCVWSHPEQTSRYAHEYWEELKELVDSGRYDKYHDFTVVLQTYLRDIVPLVDPETGKYYPDYFAPDCFHPNRRGHQEMGYLLWNNLLTPVGEKPFTYTPEDFLGYKCPTAEKPYIFTNLNSKPKKPVEPEDKETNDELKVGWICVAVLAGVALIIVGVVFVYKSKRRSGDDDSTGKAELAFSNGGSISSDNAMYGFQDTTPKKDLSNQNGGVSNGTLDSNGIQKDLKDPSAPNGVPKQVENMCYRL